jgi:hypothetical protein
MWPTGQDQPNISTLNSWGGDVVANAAIVPAGVGGAVSVFVTNPTDLVLDIDGYFDASTASNAFSFYPVTPCRVVDTRGDTGEFGGPSMSAFQPRDFPIPLGACQIPATARGYSLNATVVPDGPLGYLTMWPTGQARPNVSTLNSWKGKIVANAALVPAGTNESVSVFVNGPTNAILDINGYFGQPGGTGALSFYPVTPCRLADTRASNGPFGGPEMGARTTRSFPIPASGCGIPANAAAYSLNVTVVPDGPLPYLSAWPTGSARPNVSTLNSFDGSVVANAAIVPAGAGGGIDVFVTNPTHLMLDINGYFAGSGQPDSYTITGIVSGLTSGASVILLDNSTDALTVSTNGSFTFATALKSGDSYAVTVGTQPTGENCQVTSGGSGVVSADVTIVVVTCVAVTHTIGGTVSGLNSDASVVLLDNGTNALTVSANGPFTFATPLAVGASYAVTVGTQPTGENCQVASGGSGVVSADVTNVLVTCAPVTYSIGGTVSGLSSGASVVLLDNGTNALAVSANGPFTFATPLAFGASYTVTVGTQPAGELCQVANGGPATVSANVTNVLVACVVVTHTIGGTVSGLNSGASVVLLDNGTNALTVSADGSFTFTTPLATGATYTVTVGTQPAGETCQVANGGPGVVSADVTNVAVTCATNAPPTDLVAERALAQTGLTIALASNVLQSQVEVIFRGGTQSLPCETLNSSGSMNTGATATFVLAGNPVYPVNVYYDNKCTRQYIVARITGGTQTGDGAGVFTETATYYGPTGTTLGTMTLNVTLAETLTGGKLQGVQVHGLGVFTPASGLKAPVQLGLACNIASLSGAQNVPCEGAVVQDFPVLNLAIGSVTQINLNIATNAAGAATSVSFSGGGSAFTGPIGSLTLTNPSPSTFVIPGGTAFATTTTTGGAAAFALFPPTPTSWTLTDTAHDQKIQISVIDNTTRNSSVTIKQVSSGATLATGTVDQSGTGSITYSDASTAAITNWTVAD